MLIRLAGSKGKFDLIPYGFTLTEGSRLTFHDNSSAEKLLAQFRYDSLAMNRLKDLHDHLRPCGSTPVSGCTDEKMILQDLVRHLCNDRLRVVQLDADQARSGGGGITRLKAIPRPRQITDYERKRWEPKPIPPRPVTYKIVIEVAGKKLNDDRLELAGTSDGDGPASGYFNEDAGADPHRAQISIDDIPNKPRRLYYLSGAERIPLATAISPVPMETQCAQWDNILVPVVPLFSSATAKQTSTLTMLQPGWLYVYVNGKLWRELQVQNDAGTLCEVDLSEDVGHDQRVTLGATHDLLLLPYKINNIVQTVELGYSAEQWRWQQICQAGGLDAADLRFLPHVKQQADKIPLDTEFRNKHLTPVDLSGYDQGFETEQSNVVAITKAPKVLGIPNSPSSPPDPDADMLANFRVPNVPVVYLPTPVIDIVELLYEPATHTFYVLTATELAAFEAATKVFDNAAKQLSDAKQQDDVEQQAKAAEQVNRLLKETANTPLTKGGSASDITEVIRFKGKKWAYINSKNMKNHIRGYKLDAEMRDRSIRSTLLDADGNFSTKKLVNHMKQKFNSNNAIKSEWKLVDDYNRALTDWAQSVNSQPEVILFENKNAEGNTILKVSDDVKLMRFAAGASALVDFKPKDGKFGGHIKANTSLALAEGKLSAKGYLPNDKGYNVVVTSIKTRDGQNLQLGTFLASIEVSLFGFAGASAALSVDLEFTTQQGKLLLKGVDDVAQLKKKDPNFSPVGVGANAFVGVQAGCEAKGDLKWHSPDKNKFLLLADIGGKVKASFGAGFEGEFRVMFDNGRFYFRAKASLIWGPGCGGEVAYMIDAKHIMVFIQFLYHQLRNIDYGYLNPITDEAFKALNHMVMQQIWLVKTALEVAEEAIDKAENAYRALDDWWVEKRRELAESKLRQQHAEAVARNILKEPEILDFSFPEAKGRLLRLLCESHWSSTESVQEKAVIALLRRIKTRRDYENVVQHMSYDGSKIPLKAGEDLLDGLLDGREQRQLNRIRQYRLALLQQLPRFTEQNTQVAGIHWPEHFSNA
ncbi:MAG: hypothetical protein GXP08_01005 [Gammaproteobacteria bacterium]|nr:hypothetical protein [Gammaproteobacteria bacterium]